MARPTFLISLPQNVREAVNEKLRQAHYGGQVALAEWLREQGYQASKSSVSRYAAALKEADGMAYASRHDMAARAPMDVDGLSRRQQILIELGELRARESELLDELKGVMG